MGRSSVDSGGVSGDSMEDVQIGEIVWARVTGYPWWPATISRNVQKKTWKRLGKVWVTFFNDNQGAWIPQKTHLRPFNDASKQLCMVKSTHRSFESITGAMKEAARELKKKRTSGSHVDEEESENDEDEEEEEEGDDDDQDGEDEDEEESETEVIEEEEDEEEEEEDMDEVVEEEEEEEEVVVVETPSKRRRPPRNARRQEATETEKRAISRAHGKGSKRRRLSRVEEEQDGDKEKNKKDDEEDDSGEAEEEEEVEEEEEEVVVEELLSSSSRPRRRGKPPARLSANIEPTRAKRTRRQSSQQKKQAGSSEDEDEDEYEDEDEDGRAHRKESGASNGRRRTSSGNDLSKSSFIAAEAAAAARKLTAALEEKDAELLKMGAELEASRDQIGSLEKDLAQVRVEVRRLKDELKERKALPRKEIVHMASVPAGLGPLEFEYGAEDAGTEKCEKEELLEQLRLLKQLTHVLEESTDLVADHKKGAGEMASKFNARVRALSNAETAARKAELELANCLAQLLRWDIPFELLKESQAGKPLRKVELKCGKRSDVVASLTKAVITHWMSVVKTGNENACKAEEEVRNAAPAPGKAEDAEVETAEPPKSRGDATKEDSEARKEKGDAEPTAEKSSDDEEEPRTAGADDPKAELDGELGGGAEMDTAKDADEGGGGGTTDPPQHASASSAESPAIVTEQGHRKGKEEAQMDVVSDAAPAMKEVKPSKDAHKSVKGTQTQPPPETTSASEVVTGSEAAPPPSSEARDATQVATADPSRSQDPTISERQVAPTEDTPETVQKDKDRSLRKTMAPTEAATSVAATSVAAASTTTVALVQDTPPQPQRQQHQSVAASNS